MFGVSSQLALVSGLAQLLGLAAVIAVEQAVGWPLISTGLAVWWLDRRRGWEQLAGVVGWGVVLAVAYDLPLSVGLVGLLIGLEVWRRSRGWPSRAIRLQLAAALAAAWLGSWVGLRLSTLEIVVAAVGLIWLALWSRLSTAAWWQRRYLKWV